MKIEIVLSIVGSFGVLALTINAFFLRGIFKDLGDVKVSVAKIFERASAKELRIENLETNQKEIFDRLNIIERDVLK